MKKYTIANWRGLRRFSASYPQLGNVLIAGYVLMDADLRVKSPLPVREYRADERPIDVFSGEIGPHSLICKFRYLLVYGVGDCPLLQMKQHERYYETDIAVSLSAISPTDIRYIALIRDRNLRRGLLHEDKDGIHVRCPFEVVVILPGEDGTFASLLGEPDT